MHNNYAKFLIDQIESCNIQAHFAYIDSKLRLTYKELAKKINGTMHALNQQHLVAGDYVILLPTDPTQFPILFLSCIAFGIIPLLIDDNTSTSTVDSLCLQIGAKTILTNIAPVDTEQALLYHQHTDDSVAFMLCTSGTTGNPKIVKHKHRCFFDIINATRGRYNINNTSVILATSKMSYGYGLFLNIIIGLASRCTVVLLDKTPTPTSICKKLEKYKITHFFTNPTMLSWIVNKSTISKLNTELQFVISSSEPLPPTLITRFYNKFRINLYNGYGASELLSNVIINDNLHNRFGSIGKPISGFEFLIVDQNGSQCGPNQPGVLLCKAPNICIGYLGRETSVDQDFPNGWFHTNDIVYIDEDGFYFYVGRKGQHVKISGQWTSAAEIENVIYSSGLVHECTVIFDINKHGLTSSTAYIVPCDNTKILPYELRANLLLSYSSHLVPKEIRLMKSLPRTSRNKRIIDPLILENYYVNQL